MRFERDHVVGRAQRVAGRDVFETHGRGDVARRETSLISLRSGGNAICRMRPTRSFLDFNRVVDGVARVQRARIDTERTSAKPTNGSVMILKRRAAENGWSSPGVR